jgi:hypothetical protein
VVPHAVDDDEVPRSRGANLLVIHALLSGQP